MEIAVTLRTSLEFEDLDDVNNVQDIILYEMSPEEIIEMAQNQGNSVNIDVDVY